MKKVSFFSMALCFCFVLGTIDMNAQEGGISKTAKQILNFGESYKLKINPPVITKREGRLGIIEEITPVYSDFRIITSEDGSLTLSFETFAEETMVALYNENGISLEPILRDIVSGESWWSRNTIKLQWNLVVEKFVGSFTFKLDAGTYYLRITREQKGLSAANLSLKLINLDGNEVKQ